MTPPDVRLRETTPDDVPRMYHIQLDAESNSLAGVRPRSEAAFNEWWDKILSGDGEVKPRVIVIDDDVVGAISSFPAHGQVHVGYWIAREHWGKGIASRALELFLLDERRRPLHACAACHNPASIRVLEKNGFRVTGRRMGEETERYVACEVTDFVLD